MTQRIAKHYHPPDFQTLTFFDILGISAAVSSTLLFFFLWFQPEKVQDLERWRWLAVTGGLVLTSFTIMSLSQYLLPHNIPRNFRLVKSELRREITQMAVPLLMLGLGVFLYFYLLEFIRLNPIAFMKIQMRILLIGLSPMIVFRRFLAKDSGSTKEGFGVDVNLPPRLSHTEAFRNSVVFLYSESGREIISVDLNDLLLITSADNYVVVFSRSEKGVKKELLRTSLNKVEKLLRNHPAIFRCHRTAIVNLKNIKSAGGNSQGYRLRFDNIDRTVPVARSRVSNFRKLHLRTSSVSKLQSS